MIENFLSLADTILMGGGMAFTFLKALGIDVGRSLVEDSCLETARRALRHADECGTRLMLPEDVVVARKCASGEETWTVPVESIPPDRMGLDIGPGTRRRFRQEIEKAETVIWNGPLGVFEVEEFAAGTLEVARSVGLPEPFRSSAAGTRRPQSAGPGSGILSITFPPVEERPWPIWPERPCPGLWP